MNREEFSRKWGWTYKGQVMFNMQAQFLADLDSLSIPPAEGAEAILHRHIDKQSMDELSVNVWPDMLEAMQEFAAQQQPTAEGADKVQRCPVCMGRGLVPNNFYATTSGIGSTTQTYLPEKCRTCNGAGVIIPPYPKLQPTAEGAEEILTSLIKSLGEPTKIHNHIYEIRPYTVEGKTEWWMFHNGVGSGEPLAQWLNKFATLHAQRIADKMVEDMRQKLFSMRSSKEPMYRLSEADRLMMYGYHDCINEMLMWTKPLSHDR